MAAITPMPTPAAGGASMMTPQEIVHELDKYSVGQGEAKRAVAIALRNRWRRSHVAEPLRTDDGGGEKVTVTGSWDSEEEARAIGEEIEELQRAGDKLNEVASLVRASFQMREFDARFVQP